MAAAAARQVCRDQGRLVGFIPETHSVYRTAGSGPDQAELGSSRARWLEVHAALTQVLTAGVAHHAHVQIHTG